VFLDCFTFRIGLYSSHFGEVRSSIEAELAKWETRDPLKRLGDWLVGNRFVSADDLQKMQQEEEQRIEETFKQVTVEMK